MSGKAGLNHVRTKTRAAPQSAQVIPHTDTAKLNTRQLNKLKGLCKPRPTATNASAPAKNRSAPPSQQARRAIIGTGEGAQAAAAMKKSMEPPVTAWSSNVPTKVNNAGGDVTAIMNLRNNVATASVRTKMHVNKEARPAQPNCQAWEAQWEGEDRLKDVAEQAEAAQDRRCQR